MAAAPNIVNLLNLTQLITQTENDAIIYVLRGWLANQSATPGANELADDCWAATTMYEHFMSLLPPDQTTWTAGEQAAVTALQANATAAQAKVDAIMGVASEETVRVNNNLAAFVTNLIATLPSTP